MKILRCQSSISWQDFESVVLYCVRNCVHFCCLVACSVKKIILVVRWVLQAEFWKECFVKNELWRVAGYNKVARCNKICCKMLMTVYLNCRNMSSPWCHLKCTVSIIILHDFILYNNAQFLWFLTNLFIVLLMILSYLFGLIMAIFFSFFSFFYRINEIEMELALRIVIKFDVYG